jgi:hypothetical protein
MSVLVGARALAIMLAISPAGSLACALGCSMPTTQPSAHECHAAPVAGAQVSTDDSCADHPVLVAVLTGPFRHMQALFASISVDALGSGPLGTHVDALLPDPDTGPPLSRRRIVGLRI